MYLRYKTELCWENEILAQSIGSDTSLWIVYDFFKVLCTLECHSRAHIKLQCILHTPAICPQSASQLHHDEGNAMALTHLCICRISWQHSSEGWWICEAGRFWIGLSESACKFSHRNTLLVCQNVADIVLDTQVLYPCQVAVNALTIAAVNFKDYRKEAKRANIIDIWVTCKFQD